MLGCVFPPHAKNATAKTTPATVANADVRRAPAPPVWLVTAPVADAVLLPVRDAEPDADAPLLAPVAAAPADAPVWEPDAAAPEAVGSAAKRSDDW